MLTNASIRPLLKQIKNSAESKIVLDCSTEKIYEVLKQAQQIGMMSDYHNYLITSLDLHTVNLEPFAVSQQNDKAEFFMRLAFLSSTAEQISRPSASSIPTTLM